MVGLVETPGLLSPGAGFSVSHQRVELDINLVLRCLKGKTEITINPHSKDLRTIRLNCRQCELKRLSINGKGAPSVIYEEPYGRARLNWHAGASQYHMLRQRVEGQLRNPPEEELVVTLPKSIRIDELDSLSVEAQNVHLAKSVGPAKRESGDASVIDLTQSSKTAAEQTARFTPITVYVEFMIEKIRDGMQFVGWEDGDLRYPHAYSRNSSLPGAACYLFPCVDNPSSRCTWEVSIKCPKTIGDALKRSALPTTQLNGATITGGPKNFNKAMPNGVKGEQQTVNTDDFPNFSDEDRALDLSVVCSGDLTDEIVDPQDPTKKTTTFMCTTAVAPQHIGFAIGPFEHVDLSEFRESDEDDKLGQNAIPVHGFCLPGRIDEIRNTCLPLAKAIDFFTLTYGSYPFTSYKLCCVDDLVADTVDTMSLSIFSNRLLFPEGIIEPLDRVTRQLVHALASQWIGVNITPKEPTDAWAVVGIAYFITDMFMKKLCGNNEYRYRQKKASDRVCELDVARPSIFDAGSLIWLDPSELDFLTAKAPLVLFTLDRRLAKASGSSGLSRIISRVFLNAKVGDLPNSAISTAYFIKTCEKLGHAKLDTFFTQWVFGAGCPRFRVTQRFNKKKLVVEMLIQQVQADQPTERDLEKESFLRDVKEEVYTVYAGVVQPVFTGPMTIRIHEADGTPYEHIVEIKEATTKFDIPYNTKYKRLKRSRRQKERTAVGAGLDFPGDAQDDVLLYCLGDVLQSEEEIKEWKLTEWSKEDEDRMSQESYEWIRMDADFEWICKMSITMPGYMYLSQLQQDRDSVQFMAAQREHPLVSTILVRTLMDRRYFYGIRTAAATALSTHAKDELDWVGLHHLEKAFQEFFCYPDSPMTRSNDFSDRTAYYVQCVIPQAIAKVRDNIGRAPFRVRTFLLEKLRFNDNSNNEYSDCHYVATLMSALAGALSSKPAPSDDTFEIDIADGDDLRFHRTCLDEIDRYRRLDEWIPSYHNVLSTTALDCTRLLAKAGTIQNNPADFLQYTQDGTSDELRVNAFTNLMDIGMCKNNAILRWLLFVLGTDPSPYIREQMFRIFAKALGGIAIGDTSSRETAAATQNEGLIIEQESSTEARQADLSRKQTILGALAALKADMGANAVLKAALWEAVTSPAISLKEMGDLLLVCSLLYTPVTSMEVRLKYPRYWKCRNNGKGKLTFTRTSKLRTAPLPPLPLPAASSTAAANSAAYNRNGDETIAVAHARPLLKPPRKPTLVSFSSSAPAASGAGAGAGAGVSSGAAPGAGAAAADAVKPRLTLKLNLKGAGAGSRAGE